MRLFALAMTTALALPAFAAAQTLPALPSLDESPAERTVRRAAMTPPELQEDTALQAAVASSARPAADVARDVYRRPFETLTFWGLTPGSTIVEIEPGRAGWWRNILEPYAAATGGTYVPVNRPLEGMGVGLPHDMRQTAQVDPAQFHRIDPIVGTVAGSNLPGPLRFQHHAGDPRCT